MMDFWPENQGHLPQYTKYGTLPGRNCTQNYHDRYQGTHYPLYYSEQQDQGRESSYWTVPGSRTGGSLQDYTNWNDPELAPPTASQFPFILDRHSQQHQELREYQHQEARDREWTAIQRAAREYERGMMREGWQRRWEPVSPVHYNRDVSKRNDSSYRELEAWAARYSHSLPRRRRIEAELRGASQGVLDKSRAMERDNRSGADPRVATLPQLRPPVNIRESGLWDRGSRQQVPNYNPSSAPETSHSLDIKEKTSYQRRMFSQPPGYIAPPPYNTPHKSSPVMHQFDTSWEQELKRQVYQSQPKKQDFSKDLHDMRKAEMDHLTKPEVEVYKQRKEPGVSSSECVLSLPQTMPETPDVKTNEATYSKVIEGRKFRLNKKTGGMTIFCLVSRIAGAEPDTPCLPLCTPQTNIHSTEVQEVSKSQDSTSVSQALKLADEVDFKSQEQSSVQSSPQAKHKESPICVQSESLGEDVLNKADADVVSQQKTNQTDSTFGRQAAQSLPSAPVKYPLWREPSFTSRAETDSSSLNADSDGLVKEEDSRDIDERKEETEIDTEDSKPTLLIDTTCVVVKMELIPSPKKEHVHILSSDEQNPFNAQQDVSTDSVQLNQDVTTNTQNSETATESSPLKINEDKEAESDMSFLYSPSPSVYERETLEERAQRILGIPLDGDITDLSEKSHEEAVSPSMENSDMNKATEPISQDTSENEESHEPTDDGLCSKECNDTVDQVMNESEGYFAEPQDPVTSVSTQSTTELQPDIQTSHESETLEDPVCESSVEEISDEKNENLLDENECLNPPTDISDSLSPSTDCKEEVPALTSSDLPSLSNISESNTHECPDPELPVLTSVTNLESPHSETLPLPNAPSPVPCESVEHFPSSDCHADEPLRPLLSLTDPTAGLTEDNLSFEGQAQDGQIPRLVNDGDINMEPLIEDMTQQLDSPQETELACEKGNNVTDEHQMKEDSEVPTGLLEPIENSTEADDVQHQLVHGLTEDVSSVKESLMTDDQSKEGDQSGLDKEDTTECQIQTETEMLEQQFVKSEETAFANETHSADGLHEEAEEDPSDLKEQPEVKEIDQHPSDLVHSDQDAFANDAHTTEESLHEDADEDLSDAEQTDFKENHSQTETESETLQKQYEFVQSEEAAFVNETHTCEGDGDPVDALEHIDLTENACQTDIEAGFPNPSPPLPTNSNHEVSQSPLDVLPPVQVTSPTQVTHSPDPEFALETASVGSSALNLVPETVNSDSSEQPCQFPSPFSSDSPPAHEEHESISSNPPSAEQKQTPQYPKSLRDAVNRIRKHTAPDSENEEEEVTDMWDPDSAVEDMTVDMNSVDVLSYYSGGIQDKEPICEETEQQVLRSVDDVQEQREQDPVHEEPQGHVEDTLSCSSSNSSHDSDDTIIVAEEDEDVEAGTESKTDIDRELDETDEERSFSGEVRDETADEEDDDDGDRGKRIQTESCEREERPCEPGDTMETEQNGNEESCVDAKDADEVTA